MLDKIKSLLTKYKVHVSVVGGALVVATVYGQCTLDPDVEAVKEAVEVEAVEAAIDNSAAETTVTEAATTEAATTETETANVTEAGAETPAGSNQ